MKRFFTRCMLLMMLIGWSLATYAQQSVLNENFANGTLPAGWTKAGNYWDFSEFNAKFYAPFENAKDTLFAPVVSISELENEPTVTLSYGLGAAGANVNTLRLIYRQGGQDEWTEFIKLDQATTGRTDMVKALPTDLTTVQFAITADYMAGGSTYVYLFRIANKKEATTAPAGFKTENLLVTSVKLTWEASMSDYFEKNNLKISTTALTNPETEMGDVKNMIGETGLTDEWYNLTGLEPNTKYYAYVQYDCGYGDVSPWASLEFRTPCEAVSAPFYEDFEDGLSACYTIYKKGSATTAEVSGEYPYNSTRSFKVNIEGISDFSNYLVLPELIGDVKNYQISFMAASAESGNAYSRRVAIGVCTDPTDVAGTFSEITTLNLPKARTWEKIVVSLKGYTGQGKYITLKIGHPTMKTNLFVDDIKVEAASACPMPMFVQANGVSTGSATISWTKTGNETEWNLVVSTKPLSNPEDIEPNTAKGEFAGAISSNPYTLTGLKPNTTYYAYLQAGCGSSEWTEAIEFKTQREITYPYSEHFDRLDPELYTNTTAAIPNGWVFDDRTTLATDASYYDKQYSSDTYRPYVTTKQNHEETAYVKASLLLRGTGSGTGSTKNISSIAIAPAMPKPVNTMMVTFWAYSSAAQTVKIGVANTQTNDLAQGQQLGANITEVGEAAITGGSEWKQYKVLLTGYTGTGRYIAFYLKPGTSTPSVYIDDIEIDEAPDCNAVSTLTAEATGIDKATATWTDASSSASWTIKVSSTEIDPSAANGDIVAAQTVNTKTYNISGLAMGQTYYIYVSPSCGDAWVSTTVTTLVGLQVPYYNDFQDENQGSNAARGPKNWTLGNINVTAALGTQTNIPYVYNTAMTGAPADVVKPNLYFYHSNSATNAGAYAIMPELLNANVKDLKMSFYGSYNSTTVTANYSKGMIRVGVVDNPSDINKTNAFTKVTLIKTLYCSAPKITELFTVDFSEYAGNGKYIVFYSDTAKYNYFMLDNLTISLATDPQPVSDVEASEITQTGAKLTWTENGKAAKWEVKVFAETPEDPETAEAVWSATITEKQAVATGMNHSTQYFAYVRSVQDNGNGAWGSTSFFTECGTFATPFTEDWESWATGANTLSTCFTQTAGMQVAGSGSPNATVKTGQVIKFNATSTNKEPMLVLPEFDKPIKTLQLTMNASPYSSSYVGDASYTEIGVLEANDNFVKIAEYRFNLSDVKAWDEVFVNFGSYTGEGGRIAIRTPYATVNKTIHICFDNLVVEEIPLCGKITTIEVENIDSVSAKVSWAKGKAENKWNLKVSSTELDDPATATADIFDGQLDVQNKALTGLDGNTTYYVYVQSVDETLECTGAWSNAKTFKTLCKKQTFPYEEDFEDFETGSGKDLGCFIQCGDDANPSYVSTKGSKALWLRQATKDHNNYFVFPALAIDSVKRLQLSMQVYVGTTATYTYPFEVGVMTDPNDPTTFVATHSEALAGQTAAYDRVYTFEGYAGDETGEKFGTFIALKPLNYKNASNVEYANNAIYIDNVTIDFIETCFKPTDVIGEIGTDTVKLSWNSDNEGASYLVRVFADKDADPKTDAPVAETTVTDKEAVIRGLTGNTTYYAYVQALCSASDKSKWSTVYQFKTECPEVTALPYADDFEAYDSNTVPDCWEPLDNGTNAKSRVGTTYKFSGAKSLTVNYASVGSSSGYSYYQSQIVTPALDVENLKDLLVYFNVRSYSAGGSLKIEAVADETSQAEAITLTQINDIPADWTVAYLDLAKYYTSVQPYKRLRFTPTAQGKSIYIDDIVFTTDKSVVLPVQDLKLSMVTETTAKFSFVEYTPTITEWQVAYVAAGGDIADATILPVTTKEYTITGLAANTSYDIYVRGNVEGDEWVGPLTATTIQTPAPLPLITGFEDDADKWVIYKTKTVQGDPYPNFFIVGDADSCDATGEKALFITNDSISYAYHTKDAQGEIGFSNAWATRNINIEGAGTYKFSFKVKVPANKENESDYATAHLFPAGASILAGTATMLNGKTRAGTAVTDVPADNIYSLMGKTLHENEWIWVTKSIDVEEAGIYTLAIFWYNASVGAQYGEAIAVDSVIVEEYLCTTPKDFEPVEAKATEMTISWFGGKCKNFEYVVSKYANLGMPNLIDAEDKVAAGTLTDGPQVTITDLLPNTTYSLYVRTICPDGETDWVEYDFETPCALEELPYTESFSETPECWILKSATVGTTQVGTGSSDYEKWNRLQLSNGGMAILPELAVDLKNVEIEIGLFNTTTNLGAVQLGVMDNTWDVSTFQEIAYIQTVNKPGSTGTYTPSTLETFSKMMNLYQGTGKVLAIKNATTYSIGIKYVKLTELPDCVKPQQVEITYPTENAVTVNWLAGLEEAWEIMLNDSIIENVTSNPYRITGLEQGTTYKVAVRALCDENTKSEWSLPTTFQTPCGVNPLPLFEDFSGLVANEKPAALTCWDNLVSTNKIEQVFNGSEKPFKAPANTYYTNMWIAYESSWGATPDQLMFFGYTSSSAKYKYRWMITPQYAIEGNATLSFDLRSIDNNGTAAHPEGRFFVAISTDDGETWKKADATQFIPDSVYTTKTVSLDKYNGKNIRVAFYMEDLGGTTTVGKGSGLFTFVDNVRMNCSEKVVLSDNACQGFDYENYGFSIKQEDLPLAGEDSTYTRLALSQSNVCDTVYELTLTTRPKPQSQTIYATICQGEGYPFGDWYLTEPNPENQPYYITAQNEYGCDVYTYLYLTVLEADTMDIAPIAVENNMLPYAADDYYTIPANAPVGLQFDTIVKISSDGPKCMFNKYSVLVSRCLEEVNYSDTICESAEAYTSYGFAITADELPFKGTSKEYKRNGEHNATLCDSTVTLTLTVLKNDTTPLQATICEKEEEYNGNGFVIPANELPAKGESAVYYRSEPDQLGCDSVIELTLNVALNDTTPLQASVCESAEEYNAQGFIIPAAEFPIPGTSAIYYRYESNRLGCDSVIALTLAVTPNDTTIVPVAILNTDLPYAVDEYYTVPADAVIGSPFFVVKKAGETGCSYNRYQVLVTRCTTSVRYTEDICEDMTNYVGYGFTLTADQLPKPGTSLEFSHVDRTAQDCDSTTYLTLTVLKADTTDIEVAILNTDLPYAVDAYYTVPATTAVGADFYENVKTDGCAYNRYHVTVAQCETPYGYQATICENADSYAGYGFNIEANELPAPLASKIYTRHAMNEFGCDSVITLSLTLHNDTADIHVTKLVSELPFAVDEFYTIPADAPVGQTFEEVKANGNTECSYNRYIVMISDCSNQINEADVICSDQTTYEGYGFVIAADDMPEAGKSKQYHRIQSNASGCDNVTLTLTVVKNDTTDVQVSILNNDLPYTVDEYYTIPAGTAIGTFTEVKKIGDTGCSYKRYNVTIAQCTASYAISDAVCSDQTSYEDNGFIISADEMPAIGTIKSYTRHETTIQGCDSVITLTLRVLRNDTTDVNITKLNTELPYVVDEYYTIPAGTAIGTFTEVKKIGDTGCSYKRYNVTINQKTQAYSFADVVCEDMKGYDDYGFLINEADMPAAGENKRYTRNAMDAFGCDSVITLTLTSQKADTLLIPVTIVNTQLPYVADELYTVPADAAVGTPFDVVMKAGDCLYNQYSVLISRCLEEVAYSDTICESAGSYEGYGFSITADELPAAGMSSNYIRNAEHDATICDSIVTLTLTVAKNDTTVFDDAVCETQLTYQGYGFLITEADMPAKGESNTYYRTESDTQGCDSIIALTLAVIPNDTTERIINIDNTQLSGGYEVDAYYTVPENAVIGETFETVIRLDEDECSYRKYIVTVTQCSRTFRYAETICEGQSTYSGFGFEIAADKMPAKGESKDFTRSNMSELGCDSVITLTLTMNANDTTIIPVEILSTQLPYYVDANYTVPVDAQKEKEFEVVVKIGDYGCSYNKYVVMITIPECSTEYAYADSVCTDAQSYSGFGFEIAADDLPAAGQSKDFFRSNKNQQGCDSLITLTLKATLPEVNTITVEISSKQLPYQVDGYYTVPADALIDQTFEVEVKTGDCAYNKYIVTVAQCAEQYAFADSVCADIQSYTGYGFSITAAEMPAAGQSKPFYRTEKDMVGCDSVITLTLTVLEADTVDHLPAVVIYLDQLPYVVEGVEILSADTEEGEYEITVKLNDDDCSYDRFFLSVRAEEGLLDITDDVDRIELYDALGRKVADITGDTDMRSLSVPQGVYTIRTTMKSGAAKSGKCVIR
ncbi:MAG: choice-of-anchor J domain-containing protein [Paludibacteraceae bacterium]|nr:choice-of-anchor J domain-containing protein [Paludibacteraceae bacterium]